MDKTDINKLHDFALGNTSGRRAGKTYHACSVAVGYLHVLENSVIAFVVKSYDRVKHKLHTLDAIAKEQGLEIERYDKATYTIIFKNNSNRIVFMSENSPVDKRELLYLSQKVDPIYDLD